MSMTHTILAPTVSADASDYGDDYIGNLDADFPDLPGTAIDPDCITPAQYEAGRLLRATKINPTWNVDTPVKGRRGRKPGWRERAAKA